MGHGNRKLPSFKGDPARDALLGIYREVDQSLASFTCDDSTDCCHFGRTGREPYPTAVEVAELEHAVRAAGGIAAFQKGKSATRAGRLPVHDERRCPFLSAEGRCRIYASRPFGCRTFFCERAVSDDNQKIPRAQIHALGQRVAELSQQTFARDPGPRTLESAFERMVQGDSVLIHRRMR